MKALMVGGCIRDRFLGLPHKDRDWVVLGGTQEEMLALGFQKVGAAFPVFLHPETREEFALARREKKVAPGYKGFEVEFSPDVTLGEDLGRRDFTMNAMAMDAVTGEVFDPFGGSKDLQKGLLRAVSLEAFSEDPLRVLRMVRFACRFGLTPTQETLWAAKRAVGELETLPVERVFAELSSALLQAKKPSGVVRLLEEVGALGVLLPEIEALRGVQQPEKHHPEGDVLEHVCLCLDALKSPTVKKLWAVLFHDCGKALTPRSEWPSHHGHAELGGAVAGKAMGRMKAPRATTQFVVATAEQHMKAHKWDVMGPGSLVKWFMAMKVLRDPEKMADFVDVFDADWGGRVSQEVKDKRRMFLLKASKAATETDMTQFVEAAAKAKDPAEFWRAKFWDTACLAVTKVVQEERR